MSDVDTAAQPIVMLRAEGITPETMKQLRLLAVQRDTTVQKLIGELVRSLVDQKG